MRLMSSPTQIDAKHIQAWADTSPNAEQILPQLVRRLLYASSNPRVLDMPSGTGKNIPGWDGICEATEDSSHCPRGVSGWELSKDNDVRDKLDDDYEKRTRNPENLNARTTTYIAVTARRYVKKLDWANARKKKHKWADVRVIDADNLAQWLEECPAVATWFASEHLNWPAYDLRSLDRFLTDWSRETTDLPLPPRLILLGRERQHEQALQWSTQQRPSVLQVQATTKREAQLFVAAALESLDSVVRDELGSRTLIVESREAWRWVLNQQHPRPLILIPAFPEFEPSLGVEGHFVVIPIDRETEIHRNAIVIDEPLPRGELTKELASLGLPVLQAERLAQQSQGYLRPLQRLLGATETTTPIWIARENHAELGAMLLLGAWEPSHSGDRKAAENLGVDPEALDRLCTRLTRIEGAPLEREGQGYRWASPYDAWRLLAGTLSPRAFQRFEACAVEVLSEDHPMFGFQGNERYVAAFRLSPSHSSTLREGIAASVLHLTLHDDILRRRLGVSGGGPLAQTIIHRLLTSGWIRWASLGDELRRLAEAAPNAFLDRLAASLAVEEGVVRLFDQEGQLSPYGQSPHAQLLWALELLAWIPESMSLAVELLMRLVERDPARSSPNGRIVNRPLRSLKGVFHLIAPQTFVEEEERFTVLSALVPRHPECGFALLVELLGRVQVRVLPESASPQYYGRKDDLWLPDRPQVLARAERCLALALDAAGDVPERWTRLLGEPINQLLGDDAAQLMLDRMIELRGSFDDEGCLSVSDVARGKLHTMYRTSLHERHPVRIQQLHRILSAFEPSDPVLREAWNFEPGMLLLEPHTDGYDETQATLDRQRDAVLVRLLGHDSSLARLVQLVPWLAARSAGFRELGRALALSARSEEFDALLLRDESPAELRPLVAHFALSRHRRPGSDMSWLERLLRHWLERGREDDALATLLLRWPEPLVWDLVDQIGDPLRTRYWNGLENLGNHDGDQWERAVENLLAAENPLVALSTASYRCRMLPTELLVTVLERVVDAPERDSPRTGPDLGYEVVEVFREFDRRDDDTKLEDDLIPRIVNSELFFIGVFEWNHREPRFVWGLLEASPGFFVELLRLTYVVDPERQQLARNAHRVLEAWHSYPGRALDDDPRAREDALHDWVTRVLELARRESLDQAAESEVADVLARPTAGPDGHWPCEAARRLLETGRYPRLASDMRIAKFNQRGTTMRGSYDGGEQERTLADTYEQAAQALRATCPTTAQMLLDLARGFGHDAEREDRQARDLRLREGASARRRKPASEARPKLTGFLASSVDGQLVQKRRSKKKKPASKKKSASKKA